MPLCDQPSGVEVELPQDLTAAGAARVATRGVLGGWRLNGLLEPVLLTVSELVTNAVRYGRPPVALRLRRVREGVRIAVHDDGSEDPVATRGGLTDESGRGLLIVQALATESGVERIAGDGKVVWATIEPGERSGC